MRPPELVLMMMTMAVAMTSFLLDLATTMPFLVCGLILTGSRRKWVPSSLSWLLPPVLLLLVTVMMMVLVMVPLTDNDNNNNDNNHNNNNSNNNSNNLPTSTSNHRLPVLLTLDWLVLQVLSFRECLLAALLPFFWKKMWGRGGQPGYIEMQNKGSKVVCLVPGLRSSSRF